MSELPGKSRWRKLTKYLFCISVVGLILFNAYATIGKQAMRQSIERTQAEIETRREQMTVLQTLQKRFYNVSLPEFEKLDAQARAMHKQLPILDHEFVTTNVDGPYRSGERTIYLSVPAIGNHVLRVQATYKGEELLDRKIELTSGGHYQFEFNLSENEFQFLFPREEPANITLDNFEFTNRISNLRFSLTGGPTFTSSNQPRWSLSSTFQAKEYGVLGKFAYMSNKYELEEHLSITITAESDGPPTAAADDPATILHLGPLLGFGHEPEYRFEDGRYIFER